MSVIEKIDGGMEFRTLASVAFCRTSKDIECCKEDVEVLNQEKSVHSNGNLHFQLTSIRLLLIEPFYF